MLGFPFWEKPCSLRSLKNLDENISLKISFKNVFVENIYYFLSIISPILQMNKLSHRAVK